MPGIFSFMREILTDSREILLLSDTHGYTPAGLKSTSHLHLHLPEVWAPAQYLIDMGLRPALARRLSSTYTGFVARYRETCQSHFDRAIHGREYLTEYYREVFTILFRRTIQASGSQFVSIVRVRLCQASAPQATVCPERVDIRVDDAAKAEIAARLGLKAAHPTSHKMVTHLSADATSPLEEISEQTHALSINTVDSRLMLPRSAPISLTSRRHDPFSHVAPQTCFPTPYPPPPAPCLPRDALPTSFISSTPRRDVRSLASQSPDMSALTNLFGRMTTTTLETDSRISKSHRVFCIPDSNRIKSLSPILSPNVADGPTKPKLASVDSIASPIKPTNPPRRRKIASLPTRRGKALAPPSLPVFDSAGTTSHPITPHPAERVVEETSSGYIFAPPQKTRLVSALPSLYTVEASSIAAPKSSTPRQRKIHTIHKTLPQSQTIPQNQALTPLIARKTFSYAASRSPPLVSDATSYFDSPPTSSDELDTPPSTPPSSHVLLACTSTESLAISSESNGTVSHKEPLGYTKLPNPRQRYRRLDFTKEGASRDEQPLTFTFSV